MTKGLTSFRALAFFAIFLTHLQIVGSKHLGLGAGYFGVMAFFVLSGFLLTPILVDMKSNLSGKDFFIRFYGRRVLRIFPLYYAYLILIAVIAYFVIFRYEHNGQNLIDYRLASQSYIFVMQLPWTVSYTYDFYSAAAKLPYMSYFATHFWSLAIEEQFYLVWPLAIFFCSPSQLKRFLLLVILAAPLMRWLLAIMINLDMLPLRHSIPLVIWVLPFSHVDAFAIGGYFALYEKARSNYLVLGAILVVLMIGVFTSWLTAGKIVWGQLGYGYRMDDSFKYIWGYSVVNLTFALALVQIKNGILLPAAFEHPLLIYLGKISYGLYVFHFPVLWLVYQYLKDVPDLVRASIALSITILISAISYEFMEKRFINMKNLYFAR